MTEPTHLLLFMFVAYLLFRSTDFPKPGASITLSLVATRSP